MTERIVRIGIIARDPASRPALDTALAPARYFAHVADRSTATRA